MTVIDPEDLDRRLRAVEASLGLTREAGASMDEELRHLVSAVRSNNNLIRQLALDVSDLSVDVRGVRSSLTEFRREHTEGLRLIMDELARINRPQEG